MFINAYNDTYSDQIHYNNNNNIAFFPKQVGVGQTDQIHCIKKICHVILTYFLVIQISGYKSTVLGETNMSQLLMNSWKLFLLAGQMLLYRYYFAILWFIWLTFSLHMAQSGIISQILMLVFLQFEDFQSKWAFRLLQRYRKTYRMFNDDVQVSPSLWKFVPKMFIRCLRLDEICTLYFLCDLLANRRHL